jgi:hypothetical protein
VQIIFVLVDLANKQLATPVLDFFALTTDETKMIGFSVDENGRKLMYSGDFSLDSIKVFGEKFLTGESSSLSEIRTHSTQGRSFCPLCSTSLCCYVICK